MDWIRGLIGAILLAAYLGEGSIRGAERVQTDLLVLYDFEERGGAVVHDRSGVTPPLDLQIAKPSAAHFKQGALVVTSSAFIASEGPASKIFAAVRQSGALSIEA